MNGEFREARVLVIDVDTHLYADVLQARFPQVAFKFFEDVESLLETAQAFRPNIVFIWITKAVPLPLQRQIAMLPCVDWIQIGGAGFDYLNPVSDFSAKMTTTGGVLAAYLAEFTMTAILSLNIRLPEFMAQQRRKAWDQKWWVSVSNKTVLVIGLGKIGRKTAALARSFGMHVIGYRASGKPTAEVDELIGADQLHEALGRADYVCLHVPLTDATVGMIGSAEIAAMQPHAQLINMARGKVVDELALIDALEAGNIAGAFLDVFATEPLPESSPLWTMDNVLITPHIADSVEDWQQGYVDLFSRNLELWMQHKDLINEVDLQKGY